MIIVKDMSILRVCFCWELYTNAVSWGHSVKQCVSDGCHGYFSEHTSIYINSVCFPKCFASGHFSRKATAASI